MRIFFIVDEFPFFLPKYLDAVIIGLKGKHEIVGITPLMTPKNHKTLYDYIKSQMFNLGFASIVKLGIEYSKLKAKYILFSFNIIKNPAGISQVAKKHKIKIINTTNVNDEKYLELLKKKKIDIIVSSCSQIFKNKLLNIPQTSCINRHSALLPAYGGLFPIFQAMIHNEKIVGASVHKMITEIDKGEILAQQKFKIKKNETLFSLYRKSYEVSVEVTLNAIHKLSGKRYKKIKSTTKPSYYSFPSKDDWNTFFKKHKKII